MSLRDRPAVGRLLWAGGLLGIHAGAAALGRVSVGAGAGLGALLALACLPLLDPSTRDVLDHDVRGISRHHYGAISDPPDRSVRPVGYSEYLRDWLFARADGGTRGLWGGHLLRVLMGAALGAAAVSL